MQHHPLATVVASCDSGIVANHIPLRFQRDSSSTGVLRGHLARANPLWRELASGQPVLAIFQGEEHYISPNWYPSKQDNGKVVPTWNYVVVHARGHIVWQQDVAWLARHLNDITDTQESGFAAPWKLADAPQDYLDKMMSAVVGFEIVVAELTGKWKVSQNRARADRHGVVTGLAHMANDASAAMSTLVAAHDPDKAS